MRTPETCETFEEVVDISGMTIDGVIAHVEDAICRLRRTAADKAKELLIDNGYFNGEITNQCSEQPKGTAKVKVTLMGWGLPTLVEPGKCEDCGGLGSPPGELAGMVCGSCNGTGIESDEEID